MSMIERVARAIWNIRREEEDRCDMALEEVGRDHSVWAEARAAIEAMREPTDLMGGALPSDYRPGSHSATQIWRAMIDAALKGEAE